MCRAPPSFLKRSPNQGIPVLPCTDPHHVAATLRRSGVLQHFGTSRLAGTDRLHFAFAQLTDLSVTRSPLVPAAQAPFSWGVGRTPASAAWCALGEALERFCAVVAENERLVRGRRASSSLALDPASLVLLEDQHYDNSDFVFPSPDVDLTWIPGHVLSTNKPILVPATAVFAPFVGISRSDHFLPPTTTGLGCGRSVYDAIIHGIHEIVERDALARSWHSGGGAARLSQTSVDSLGATLGVKLRKEETVRVLKLPTDAGFAAMMAVLESPGVGTPAVSVGFGCCSDAARAAVKALQEALLYRHLLSRLHAHHPETFTAVLEREPVDALERATFLWHPRNRSVLDRLGADCELPEIDIDLDSPLDKPPATERPNAQTLCFRAVKRLVAAGYDVVVVDLTRTVVRDLGLAVVRVIVPGFQPLATTHRAHRLGPRCAPAASSKGNVNPHGPHPFPI